MVDTSDHRKVIAIFATSTATATASAAAAARLIKWPRFWAANVGWRKWASRTRDVEASETPGQSRAGATETAAAR